jgi:hypothetical protein
MIRTARRARNDQWKAPTPDLEGHRKRLREALGNTLSDEFVDVILGKLVEALRPGLYDQLDEATLNAALATMAVGTSSWRSPNRFPSIAVMSGFTPVALPPGRLIQEENAGQARWMLILTAIAAVGGVIAAWPVVKEWLHALEMM